jgi:ribonucleoside-diphosphate reductase alpha chain
VIYREQQATKRAARQALSAETQQAADRINVTQPDGSKAPLDLERLQVIVSEACAGLDDVDESRILDEALKNLYDGVSAQELATSLVITARTLIEQEPNYTYASARLLCDNLRAEALAFLGVADSATQADMDTLYAQALPAYIARGVELELLDPRSPSSIWSRSARPCCPSATCSSPTWAADAVRPLLHPQQRSALRAAADLLHARGHGPGDRGEEREARAIEFYRLLSSFDYMSSTPTLFNAGTLRPQLSSCYLTTVPDDLHGIYGAIQDNAMLSKFAGGLGNDWTPVRALGSYIKGTNGKSQGVVPFLKVVNDTAVAVNQGGKRKGAVCSYLETWHLDIEEFVELRKNTGDDRRRTHDMNTANWIPDLFMKRVFDDGDWTLFSPNDVPDLHDLYGKAFEARYTQYEAMAASGELKLHKTVKAQNLWRKMLGMLFETGHPWMTFKDPATCAARSSTPAWCTPRTCARRSP